VNSTEFQLAVECCRWTFTGAGEERIQQLCAETDWANLLRIVQYHRVEGLAWQALSKFDGRAALSTWLYTIARNTCLTAIERERRLVPLEDFAEAADDDGDPMVFGRGHAGAETAGQAAAEYDVAKLLEQLPEPYRRVVVLFYLEDRSCEEVGELLSMPTGTVKALLHRGRKKLAVLAGEMENES